MRVARRSSARTELPAEQRCSVCGQVRPASDFYRVKNRPFSLQSRCKPCSAIYAKAAHERRALRLSESDQTRIREYKRGWARSHPEAGARNRARQRAENEERFLSQKRARESRRRTAKRDGTGRYTAGDLLDLCARQKGRCAACAKSGPLTTDHIVPLSQGGHDGPSNLQLLCRPCNSSKSARRSEEFMRERGFLL